MKYEKSSKSKGKDSIKVDIIILGCSLPGIVTAHKLKKKFGNTMDIVVLDLAGTQTKASKCNVAFQNDGDSEEEDLNDEFDATARQLLDNVARYYLAKFAREFNMPLPDSIVAPRRIKTPLNKLFQFENGSTVQCSNDFHDFDYLSFLEKLELNQYQTLLDQSMRDLFHTMVDSKAGRKRLLYYDQTTMEKHICDALLFKTSRKIMRTTVRLVCGVSATNVSVLFYLHQCYRTSSSKNHLDGDNTRFREKLLGFCRKRLASKLQQSVADITVSAKSIKEIRTYTDEQVILETTIKGEANYVCNLLAMALNPDQLNSIQVENQLLSDNHDLLTRSMTQGKARKFLVQYEDNFWSRQGYSGDILSIRGPIIWAMERPKLSTTGSLEKYAALIGYLIVREENKDSREAVLQQLVKLFGEEAAEPISYKESNIADVFVPCCGDFVALRWLTTKGSPKFLEWGALDLFADGDVAAALEAGNTAYLHLLSCLRPQAQTYEDLSAGDWPHVTSDNPFKKLIAKINIVTGITYIVLPSVLIIGLYIMRNYLRS